MDPDPVPFNCEQMFIDALGREPTADELSDIKVNLWMLSRAGLDIESSESAALVAPWAWIWARLPRPRQAPGSAVVATDADRLQAETDESSNAAPTRNPCTPAPAAVDHEALACALATHLPPLIVEHRIDGHTIARALRDSFTMLWIALGAFAVGVTGAVGWHYGALHERSACALSAARLAEPPHRLERSPRPTAHAAHRF